MVDKGQLAATETPLTMVTCYDASFARLCAKAGGLDYVLVGDSMGMVVYGQENTNGVSLRQMMEHVAAVKRGLQNSGEKILPIIIADMPAGTYEFPEEAIDSANKLIEAGAEIVKLEGPVTEVVAALDTEGIRVCGHIGLTPQSIHDYKLQGKTPEDANRLFREAKELELAGVELLVLEMIPRSLAAGITNALKIPTIGIGAGPECSGQVLVLYDLLGLNLKFQPRFLKRFADGELWVEEALRSYRDEVVRRDFPSKENSF
ncbi:MAG: 3-methyl-2-oxobutanoate hydroxymethyltransferase [Deltaproteobacteria bacterium CG11_big_fil_rev_8_21_14_0_20_45_16]|nr:MAG: 3-methyl-2-oxobutanoate hydroxymethyltransferase [Deltaproteobacteria bacterium CG11_big_fil_rev_8_21_14_0_20_45_16]